MVTETISGGAALEAALRDIEQRVRGGGKVSIGFPVNATYPDKNHTPVAQVAMWLNYGTRNMPPRPFFTNMVEQKSPRWPNSLGNLLVNNNYDVHRSLEQMGEGIAGQLRQSIIDFNSPPDSAATMKRKRAANGAQATLVDTGHLLRTVTYFVDDE